jgi:lipid-binding SYLF domain-containing protein
MKILRCLLIVFAFAAPPGYADWQPDPQNSRQLAARATVDAMLEAKPDLQPWFEQAWGYAVFPRVWRVGAMWGGFLGYGITVEQGEVVGDCSQFGAGLGPQLGIQTYKQVVLFKDAAAMEMFQRGRLEFQGRASVAAIVWGGSAEPAHLPDVAIFSMTEVGLMFEASANVTKYGYQGTATEPATDAPPARMESE